MWRRCAQQQRRNERLASQRARHARQDLLAGAMSVWLQYALTKQRAKATVARCQSRHASHLLQHGFQAFQVVTQVRKARAQLIQGMLIRVQVSLCCLLCSSVVFCLMIAWWFDMQCSCFRIWPCLLLCKAHLPVHNSQLVIQKL
jgi:hypothetical protein